MIACKLITGSFFLVSLWLLSSFCHSTQPNTVTNSDTVVLARSNQAFTINSSNPFYQVRLATTRQQPTKGRPLTLIMDSPKVKLNPDGVYEVYLCNENPDLTTLTSSNPCFVNVLDLYSLTAPDPPRYLSVNINQKVKELLGSQQYYLIILFRGNRLPDNMASKQAGEFTVSGVRLIE